MSHHTRLNFPTSPTTTLPKLRHSSVVDTPSPDGKGLRFILPPSPSSSRVSLGSESLLRKEPLPRDLYWCRPPYPQGGGRPIRRTYTRTTDLTETFDPDLATGSRWSNERVPLVSVTWLCGRLFTVVDPGANDTTSCHC